jgi:hypothetical protein
VVEEGHQQKLKIEMRLETKGIAFLARQTPQDGGYVYS